MLWEELSALDFAKAAKDSGGVCVLPIGVLEKHGDHLPLGTDMYIVRAVIEGAAKKSPAVIFPYYYLGQIAEAKHESGTIAPSHRLMMDALLEMCDEICRNGFSKIIILSGHGGNLYFLPYFAQMLPGLRSYAVYSQFVHNISGEQREAILENAGGIPPGLHAGILETSLIMHIRPDLVSMNKVKVEQSKPLKRLDDVKATGAFTAWDWYADYPHHFAGDPTKATPEHGKFIFDILVDNTVDLINAVKRDEATSGLIKEFEGRVQHN